MPPFPTFVLPPFPTFALARQHAEAHADETCVLVDSQGGFNVLAYPPVISGGALARQHAGAGLMGWFSKEMGMLTWHWGTELVIQPRYSEKPPLDLPPDEEPRPRMTPDDCAQEKADFLLDAIAAGRLDAFLASTRTIEPCPKRAAALWSVYLSCEITPADVAQMMVLLKVGSSQDDSEVGDTIRRLTEFLDKEHRR